MLLDFEKPISELETKLADMKELAKSSDVDVTKAVAQLESKILKLKKETFANLTRWQRVQLSRHPERPYTLDYIYEITEDFIELHGDRTVADDKAIYAYVPAMIRYYLNEEPILNNVPTYQMENKDERELVFANMENMVIKETNQSGGYGMVMGNKATEEELEAAKIAILDNPRNFIAQPIIQLSTVPCYIDGELKLRHVDLRPYALCGPNGVKIVPGGLTRVALKEGSLVVNSSQGGGSKDTWILK